VARKVADVTVEILKDIRDAVRETNVRLEAVRVELKAEIAQTNARLDAVEKTLDTRLDAVEKTLAEMAAQLLFLSKFTKNVMEQQEGRLQALESRVARIEARQGQG
jgi:flagellar capping protein FliD